MRKMTDDLISRKAAVDVILQRLDALTGLSFGTSTFRDGLADGYARVMSDLQYLPPTEPEPHWIACTERLPEPNVIEENTRLRYYLTQNDYGDMMVCSWNGIKWEQIYQLEPTDDEIVAWMTLPEPWKGDV